MPISSTLFSKIILIGTFLGSNSVMAQSFLVVCTVHIECASIASSLSISPKKVIVTDQLPRSTALRFIEGKTQNGRTVYVLQPRYGGSNQKGQLKSVEETIAFLENRKVNLDAVFSLGTAGGVSPGVTPGDVMVYLDQAYIPLPNAVNSLPGENKKINQDEGFLSDKRRQSDPHLLYLTMELQSLFGISPVRQ